MDHSEGIFRGMDGLELSYQRWRRNGQPRGVLAIVHGFGEHSGRYMNIVNRLTGRGYVVYGFDQRGHGRSPGQRGHINCWEEYRGDLKAFLNMIGKQEPNLPLFLLGHSMGALVALDYLLCHPAALRGAIISGAPLEPAGVAKPYLVILARFLSRLWPRFSLPLKLDPSALSRDPAVVKAYETDRLVHGVATSRWGMESLATIERVKAQAAEVKVPMLLIHGGADRLNSPNGSRGFFENVNLCDKELKVYPGTYHEPHNDMDCEQVAKDIEQWLERHL
jgi:alpha-beta hydrolase superfamily lysophospholipase